MRTDPYQAVPALDDRRKRPSRGTDRLHRGADRGTSDGGVQPAGARGVPPTALVRETGLAPQSTVQEGGEAVLSLALSTERASATGGYYSGLEASAPHDDVLDPGKRLALRESTERLLGR
ncbi:hypothetical protein [Streptomyces sp. Je 1-332]|uniref:hypothetical protein n=1 Tax=Streptomyces sp. Je 1-332 TaxID=3231270 RepID=UPI003457BC5F